MVRTKRSYTHKYRGQTMSYRSLEECCGGKGLRWVLEKNLWTMVLLIGMSREDRAFRKFLNADKSTLVKELCME